MILNPPRSEAELSPRLRALLVHAADQFEVPEEFRPFIPRLVIVGCGLASLFLLIFLATHAGVDAWIRKIESPSSFALKANEFRAVARRLENEASQLRALPASGKPGILGALSLSYTPRLALRGAIIQEAEAAGFRRRAYVEERQDLGLPVP